MKLAILIITFDLDCLHILLTNYIYFQSGNAIDDFIGYYRTKWPDENILLKLQILLKKRKTGFRTYGEQGGESIHNEFNQHKIM